MIVLIAESLILILLSFLFLFCQAMEEDNNNYKSLSEFVKKFYIPSYVISPESEPESEIVPPESPVLVFVNSKIGGQLGGELFLTYRSLLNDKQVFDLGVETPDKVLRRIYLNLERLKEDDLARHVRDKLKIIVS